MFGGLNADKYDRQYGDKALVKRLFDYFAPYKRQVITLIVLVITFSITGAVIPVIMALGVGSLEAQGGSVELVPILAALFVAVILDYGIFWVRRRLTGRVVATVVSDMRLDAFKAAIRRDLAFYDENKTGKVVSRITSDTQDLSQVIVFTLDIVSQVFEFVLLFVLLLTREWRLTLIMLIMMPVVLSMSLFFRWVARIATRQGSRAMAVVNDNIQESVTGIAVAKNFRQESMVYGEFTGVNNQSYTINLRRGFVLATVFPALNAVAGFAIATVVYIGATYVSAGLMGAGLWFLFVQSLDRFWFPFINLSAFWSQLQQGLSAAERIFALIDAKNGVVQTADETPPPLKGKIEFRNVVFQYGDTESEPILDDFSLTIQPGESVAFVGHTGAGKSTIARLIARFYEFQSGEILIDGHDIRSFNLQQYRTQLGIVPQQPFLFSGTVRDNIGYANRQVTDAEVEQIARSIGGGDWLEALPDGLQTEVGERGVRLSMGQRQLVSLIRVLAQKPAIFVLDEATASIDPFTESQIQEALDLILAESTSILIAHRLSTVRSADRIIVLDHGRIIEQGSHESL
ncbi:MAG TPA: ABC transporter ATP-binding protein, partial [Candidatus Limnocylindrales bacterium]|nr:ABC transporter ATP-binding protein [Candidatus Limnocylindrales bacterium]